MDWDWIFRGSIQWHATAIVLLNLCNAVPSPEVDRAWTQIEAVFRRHENEETSLSNDPVWQPLVQLRESATFRWQHQSLGDDLPRQDTSVTRALMTGGPRAEPEPVDTLDLPVFAPFDTQELYLPNMNDSMVME
jgi:hypothetical protein